MLRKPHQVNHLSYLQLQTGDVFRVEAVFLDLYDIRTGSHIGKRIRTGVVSQGLVSITALRVCGYDGCLRNGKTA